MSPHAPPPRGSRDGWLADAWRRVDTRFPQVDAVFDALMAEARVLLPEADLPAYLEAARVLGKLGRGVEPMLVFLEEWPSAAQALGGPDALHDVMAFVMRLQKSPNGKAIAPFLQTLAPVARRLQTAGQLQHYLAIATDLMERTTGSIHGHHTTFPSPGLPPFFEQAPHLLGLLSLQGLKHWVDYGVRNHHHHPERQTDYFSLQSADARAVLQRERRGVLFADVERKLDLYLRAMWAESATLVPYSTAFHELRQPVPYYDALGLRVPDVFDAAPGVSGMDRYRAVLAHMAGHRRWSRPLIADNWSPFQRMAVECFEDARIDRLITREYPGLGRVLLALHPRPVQGACDDRTTSCLRHRLAMVSRAMLDPAHGYTEPLLLQTVERLNELLADGEGSTAAVAEQALAYVARSRRPSDQFAKVWFDDTVVPYRDDNRHLWRFIEDSDDEDFFDDPEKARVRQNELQALPPRHYPEWDHHSQTYRPDWVSLYEHLHPRGNPADIDALLNKHAALAKRLKRVLDLLKPQDKVRIRYQEEGSELDLDVAIRSLIDWRGGAMPDPRINMSHRTDGRHIAVSLLLDLSESLNQPVPGGQQTVLELSQEAVALLAWAIERLGDPFAIAGFHSNTRHDVRYLHIKGYGEAFGEDVKARMAAMQAGWSTRMGAALRHAAHTLAARPADKKLLLVLTDGQPSDVDSPDERQLIEDTRRAVRELDRQGIYTHCISLDPNADAYVGDIFGQRHTVIDRVERLPERLPGLFLALTR
ncbi:nitric oxide reductase activation protein NorD [Hydrogenophaga sp.]|uniref:nitric oxide reductase activation protein NorD n=1 Tax=Hydrogenophaga sp. TaxID=1904254 RepID=UPI0035B36F0D